MNEIICPHCGKAFRIDDAGYADILKQVRDSDFEKQLHERLELAEQDKRNAVELTQVKASSELQKASAAKNAEIEQLKAELEAGEVKRKLAVSEALSSAEKDRAALALALEKLKQEKETAFLLAEAKHLNELQKTASANEAEIQGLKAILDASEYTKKIAIIEAVGVVEKERGSPSSTSAKGRFSGARCSTCKGISDGLIEGADLPIIQRRGSNSV